MAFCDQLTDDEKMALCIVAGVEIEWCARIEGDQVLPTMRTKYPVSIYQEADGSVVVATLKRDSDQ